MKIKITNEIAYGIDKGLGQMQLADEALGGKLVYSIVKNKKLLSDTIKSCEETKKSIWDKYVEKDKDGKFKMNKEKTRLLFKTKEDEQKAIDEFNEVLATEIEQELFAIKVDDINIEINFNETIETANGPVLRYSHVPLVFDHLVVDEMVAA